MQTLEKLLKQDKDISGQALGRIYILNNVEDLLINRGSVSITERTPLDMAKWRSALHWIEKPENIGEKVIYYRYVSLSNWLRLLDKDMKISFTYCTTVYRSLLMEVIAPLSCIGTADAILRNIPILTTQRGRDRAEAEYKKADHELVRGFAVIEEGTCKDLSEDGTAYRLPDDTFNTLGGLWLDKYEDEEVAKEIANYMEIYDNEYKTLLTHIATLEVFAKKLGMPELKLLAPDIPYLDKLQDTYEGYKGLFIDLLEETPYLTKPNRENIKDTFLRCIPTSQYATFKVSETAKKKAEKEVTRNLNHFQSLDFERVEEILTL